MTREEYEQYLAEFCANKACFEQQGAKCDKCMYDKGKADAFKDCILENGEYCWQRCVAIEHCQECKCLGNGEIDYFS